MIFRILLFVLLGLSPCYSNAEEIEPWLTGSLIAPRGVAVPFKDFEIDSYVYFFTFSGSYNDHWKESSYPNFYSLNPQWLCYFGLTPWMDITVVPQFFYNTTEGQSFCGFGDFSAGLDFQLYPDDAKFWFPGIKFSVIEIFPTGKFDHLSANKLETDITGAGSFATLLSLILYKAYHISGTHFFSLNLSGQYSISSPVNVHGLNVYGGGEGTDGKVIPGNILTGICSFEYSLNRNWALALDTVWIHVDEFQFFGDPGLTDSGEPATVDGPSSEQLSFAPAFEYNFSENLGIIAGCWFTVLGRNIDVFQSATMNLYYYY